MLYWWTLSGLTKVIVATLFKIQPWYFKDSTGSLGLKTGRGFESELARALLIILFRFAYRRVHITAVQQVTYWYSPYSLTATDSAIVLVHFHTKSETKTFMHITIFEISSGLASNKNRTGIVTIEYARINLNPSSLFISAFSVNAAWGVLKSVLTPRAIPSATDDGENANLSQIPVYTRSWLSANGDGYRQSSWGRSTWKQVQLKCILAPSAWRFRAIPFAAHNTAIPASRISRCYHTLLL